MKQIIKCLKMIQVRRVLMILSILASTSFTSTSSYAKSAKKINKKSAAVETVKKTTSVTPAKKTAAVVPAKKIVKITFKKQPTKKRIPANIPTKLPEKKIVEVTFNGPAVSEADLEPLDKSVIASEKAVKAGKGVTAPEKIEARTTASKNEGIAVQADEVHISVPDTTEISSEQKVAVKVKSQHETWNDFQRSAEDDMADY